jgi:hypothetical protein
VRLSGTRSVLELFDALCTVTSAKQEHAYNLTCEPPVSPVSIAYQTISNLISDINLKPKSHQTNPNSSQSIEIMGLGQNDDTGVKGGAKFVTSTVGSTVSGLTNTVGGVVGAVGRGLGETVTGATGAKSVGDGVRDMGQGVENGAADLAKGAKDAGEWKS